MSFAKRLFSRSPIKSAKGTQLNLWAKVLIACFTVLYCCISLVNHYYLRTETLDYGLYTNALWDYAHFQFNYTECLNEARQNILYDHFDLYLMLFAPLGYIFKSYTLLVVQIASISLAGLAIFKIGRKLNLSPTVSVLVMVFFYSHYAIYSALAFDYHSNVVSAMIVPWFLLALLNNHFKTAWLLAFLVLIGKENMGLFFFFVCIALAIVFFKDKKKRNHLVGMGAFSAVYFVLVLEVVMPALSNSGSYAHFDYGVLGSSMSEAIVSLVTRSFHYLQYLFYSQHDESLSDVKMEFWAFFLISGGLVLIRKPIFILMLIPIFFQKMYNSRGQCWGINDQYSIEIVPVVAIAIFYALLTLKNETMKRVFMVLVIAATVGVTHASLTDSIKGPRNDSGQFFKKSHFNSRSDRAVVMEALDMIPNDASVVGTSQMIGQLAYRDHAFRLPQYQEADYFVQDKLCSTFPLKREAMDQLVAELKGSGEWEVLKDNKYMLVLKRKVSVMSKE